jgi:hypothetical protein
MATSADLRPHGDSGARQILLSIPQNLRLVPVPNAAKERALHRI